MKLPVALVAKHYHKNKRVIYLHEMSHDLLTLLDSGKFTLSIEPIKKKKETKSNE